MKPTVKLVAHTAGRRVVNALPVNNLPADDS